MTPLATEGVRNADSMQKTRCQTPLSPSEINNLIEALHQGVTPATGCTEPIALAYAAARAKPDGHLLPGPLQVNRSSTSQGLVLHEHRVQRTVHHSLFLCHLLQLNHGT